MDSIEGGAYALLCDEAAARGDTVRLGRTDVAGWILEVVVTPRRSEERWQAAGILFHDLLELDGHSAYLLAWLRASPIPQDGNFSARLPLDDSRDDL